LFFFKEAEQRRISEAKQRLHSIDRIENINNNINTSSANINNNVPASRGFQVKENIQNLINFNIMLS
jgi:hypothetical protein